MYRYCPPTPIAIPLIDDAGFQLRQKAAEYVATNKNETGAERGSSKEQAFGALAEIVVRNRLGMPEINPQDHPFGFDFSLPSGIKVDVKCRGGKLAFRETYDSDDGVPREAKHNFFARQVFDPSLNADIYLMTHLQTAGKTGTLPGTNRERKWTLFICGWVSKERVARDGIYLPRKSLTEQGNTWFPYRGMEIEFYHRNLNGLERIEDLFRLESRDVGEDKKHEGELHLTSADAQRIAYDLVGRGVLSKEQLQRAQEATGLSKTVKPILHANQYFHLLRWLKDRGVVSDQEIQKARETLSEEPFSGI